MDSTTAAAVSVAPEASAARRLLIHPTSLGICITSNPPSLSRITPRDALIRQNRNARRTAMGNIPHTRGTLVPAPSRREAHSELLRGTLSGAGCPTTPKSVRKHAEIPIRNIRIASVGRTTPTRSTAVAVTVLDAGR
ncbi:hypothetical protein JCM13591A_36240 [Microbacterium xylanilyticum]